MTDGLPGSDGCCRKLRKPLRLGCLFRKLASILDQRYKALVALIVFASHLQDSYNREKSDD